MKPVHQHPGRPCLILLTAVAWAPLGSAQAQPQRRGLPAPTESIYPSHPVEITMHRFNRLPAVDVQIDGRGPFRMIVDTGAAGVVLKSELAKELELKPPPGLPAGAAQVKLQSPGNRNIAATRPRLELQFAPVGGFKPIAVRVPLHAHPRWSQVCRDRQTPIVISAGRDPPCTARYSRADCWAAERHRTY